jgi:hypothetical protein
LNSNRRSKALTRNARWMPHEFEACFICKQEIRARDQPFVRHQEQHSRYSRHVV